MEELSALHSYDWCGVYALSGETLTLDEFVGEETEHTEIPVGVGVCGTAVSTGETQNVRDVRSLSNYLSCSVKTRSELVVLIRSASGAILGQIDIDSHQPAAFDVSDERLLEALAEVLGERWQ